MTNEELLAALKERFEAHVERHEGVEWATVKAALADEFKLAAVKAMEESEGEPDVVTYPDGTLAFFDCAAESPLPRRNLTYDEESLASRKEHKPVGSVEGAISAMGEGIKLLDEHDYFLLNSLGKFDHKTQSWIKTPAEVRTLGGALFGDNRFERTFIYHNGAESYYRIRGFRTKVVL